MVISRVSFSVYTMAPGTVAFMPPEALQNRPEYGLSIDVFSIGCVYTFVEHAVAYAKGPGYCR